MKKPPERRKKGAVDIVDVLEKLPWLLEKSVHWDIQVDASIDKPFVEYIPGKGIVIRANSIDIALALVNRGRELAEKYP